MEVLEVAKDHLLVEATTTCEIGSRRHMNFPGLALRLPTFTQKDQSDLLFAIQHKIHYIAASFIRNADAIGEIRNFLNAHGGTSLQIIAKIENQEGIENTEEIVKAADGIMIARGDLGIEIPIHELPYEQQRLIDTCRAYGRTCIMATELLKSMVSSPFPTRAEVSDVYNSVIAGVDATMLSDETAIGSYPVQTVALMSQTIHKAEQHLHNQHTDFNICKTDEISLGKKYLVKHALTLADELAIPHVLLFTHSGFLAKVPRDTSPTRECLPLRMNRQLLIRCVFCMGF